jgi:predicted NBD/HSP70 family sugar kinase
MWRRLHKGAAGSARAGFGQSESAQHRASKIGASIAMVTPSPFLARRKSIKTELAILKLIQERPSISRVELAQAAYMSTAAITSVVGSLWEHGLLIESETASGKVGRRRIGLRLRSELGSVVGVDLGTFNLRIAVTDLNGAPLATRSVPAEMHLGRPVVLERCFRMVREVVAEAGLGMSAIKGIGFAFSGVMDVENGMILSYPRPGLMESWRKVPLQKIVEEEFAVPCVLEDSVRAIAITEHRQGAGAQFDDFVYVEVGIGIGSSIFINGRLYRGCNGSAGEFGHITIDEDGPLCCCGGHGCLEALASSARVIENVKTALQKGVSSKVLELAQDDPANITIEIIAHAAQNGDSLAYRALSEAAAHIGAACADLVNLLNPEAIIFGGALFRAAPEILLDHLKRLVRHRALEKSVNDVVLLKAQTASDAGALGMARIIAGTVMESVYQSQASASA